MESLTASSNNCSYVPENSPVSLQETSFNRLQDVWSLSSYFYTVVYILYFEFFENKHSN